MTEDQNERLVQSFEAISGALKSIARTMEMDYQQKYPSKKSPRDLHITTVPTEEDKLREEQGNTGEPTIDKWIDLEDEPGPRERAFMENENGGRPAGEQTESGADRARR